MTDYTDLPKNMQLRVDAQLMDHFRDNRGDYANTFRHAVRELARQNFDQNGQKGQPDYVEAYSQQLSAMRNRLAASDLPALNSNNVTFDARLLRQGLAEIGRDMVVSLASSPVTNTNLNNAPRIAQHTLESIRRETGSDLEISGKQEVGSSVNTLRDTALGMQRQNLRREYGSEIEAATRRLQTRLGDRLEAESLRVAINELNNMGWVEKSSPFSDQHQAETKEAVANSLRQRGVVLADKEIDAVVKEATPLAAQGHVRDPGGNRSR